MNRESTPASLETTHSYTAVSSTVGAITTNEPDVNNLKKNIERNKACIYKGFDSTKQLNSHLWTDLVEKA